MTQSIREQTPGSIYLPSVNLLFSIDALRVSRRVLCRSHSVQDDDRHMPLRMLQQRLQTGFKPSKWSFSTNTSNFCFISCSHAAISRSKYGTCLDLLSLELTAALCNSGSKIVAWNIDKDSANIYRSYRRAHCQALMKICHARIYMPVFPLIIDTSTQK